MGKFRFLTLVSPKEPDGVELLLDPNENLGSTEIVDPFDDQLAVSSHATGTGAFAFRKRDAALRAAWDAELEKIIGGDEHRELIGRFGFTAAELPGKYLPEGQGARR